jgi:hypothetical protein
MEALVLHCLHERAFSAFYCALDWMLGLQHERSHENWVTSLATQHRPVCSLQFAGASEALCPQARRLKVSGRRTWRAPSAPYEGTCGNLGVLATERPRMALGCRLSGPADEIQVENVLGVF